VNVHSVTAVKLDEAATEATPVQFDIEVKMEEAERKEGRAILRFVFIINTKPSVAKFQVEGAVTLTGPLNTIDKMLSVDPETRVPVILQKIYQHIFSTTMISAHLIAVPYPPPNLFYSPTTKRTTVSEPAAEPKVEPKSTSKKQ
jgi:hypothetical protein